MPTCRASRQSSSRRPDDAINPVGVKGIGELGNVGTDAAVANAVFHATGKRIRDLPITLDKLFRDA